MSTEPAPAVVRAPAKLTLNLRITGVRPDGYHLIDAEMVSLDLADTLVIEPTDHLAVSPPPSMVDGASGAAIDLGDPGTNLVARALNLVGRRASVTVTKRIPPGAGLGGGSADAAAILRWAGYRDLAGAAGLGADVPFCLVGGRARVTGIGERIEALAHQARTFTLCTPPFGCATAAVYRRFDELGGASAADPDAANQLTRAALAIEPRLDQWRDRLARLSGLEPRLAGSGSTWFVEGAFPGDGLVVARTQPSAPSEQP